MDQTEADKLQAEEYKNQGNKEFKANNFAKAIEFYTKAIDTSPNEPSYYANRAACYLSLKKYLKCIEDCNETLSRDPRFVKALKRKAKSLFLTGQTQEATNTYRKAMELDPSDKSIKDEMQEVTLVEKLLVDSSVNIDNKRYSDALMEIKKALSICPDLNIMKIKQIECLAKMGHVESALQVSHSCFNELSTNLDFLYARGLALLYNGQNDSAKKVFMEGLRLDPDNEKCRTAIKKMNRQEDLKEKGNTEFKSGNYEEALKKYTEAIEMDANNKNLASVLYSNRATVLMKMKKYKEAINDCNKAIELNENFAKAFVKRGEIHMELGQYDEAAKDFKQARQLDPSTQGLNQRIQEAEREHKKSLRKDYYKILEIEKTADENEIKKAYKKLALKWHPDKNGETEETRLAAESKFKDINEAYSILSDPQKKKRFDMGADLDDEFNGGFGGGGVDPNVIFRTFFGGGGDDGGFSNFGNGGPFGGFSSTSGGFSNGGFTFKFSKR